ncbi:MAG: hypothetical protein AAF432_05840 [Planctomycetota bacterium]
MYTLLKNLDRRWVFLAMGLSIAIPILMEASFPEKPTGLSQNVFDVIEGIEDGSTVLMAWDYDPASEGELGPMATAMCRHACEKNFKMIFMSLFSPAAPQMVENTFDRVIESDFPDLVYGVDYCNLGYKAGEEAVIKVVATDIRSLFRTDQYGTSLDDLQIMQNIKSVQDCAIIINVSAGYPGTQEWVQIVATPYDMTMVSGCTGVQAPLFYPYIHPDQMPGMLAAIKGAAEYEALVMEQYGNTRPVYDDNGDPIVVGQRSVKDEDGNEVLAADGTVVMEDVYQIPGKYLEGKRRMGPQLIAHIVIILLIVLGNWVFFQDRAREGRR